MFFQFVPDSLQHAYDIAGRAVWILHTHIDYVAVIRDAVKLCMYFDTAFSEFLPDVPWKGHISSAVIRHLIEY